MPCVYIHNCATCVGGEHIFRKIMKKGAGKWKMEPKELRWRVWCLYVRAWWGRKTKMLRYHRLGSVLSGPINSKPTFFQHILRVQRRPWHDKNTNRRDKGTIGAKKGLQKRLYPTPFEVQKVIFWLKCLVSIFRIVLPVWAGSTFSEKLWKKWSENEKRSQKTLDGEFDA